ncbi:FYVE zinc finger-domain-containing protein [Blakeslea trispora]|nr:FYVE zinc finger-domain-containing protein [Blakeslea trispora]
MTELAVPPSLLMTSPPTSLYACNNNTYQRRASVRRGTIASLSKDVRANDVVQIVKQKKAQKERVELDTHSALKRRHSMANLNQPSKPANKQKTLPPRKRTMSIGNLRSTEENKQPMSVTAKFRLDDSMKAKRDEALGQQRKCVACHQVNPTKEHEEQHQREQEPGSSASSVTTLSDDILPSKNTSSTSVMTTKEIIIQDLTSSITNYTSQVQGLSCELLLTDATLCSSSASSISESCQGLERRRSSSVHSSKIQECKALIVHQQELLSKLEALCLELPNEEKTSCQSDAEEKTPKEKNGFVSNMFQSFVTPKPATTQIVVKQTADKNELETVFCVEGICTTTETSLIPQKFLNQDTINPIACHRYALDITHTDRKEKFVLKPSDQWQSDKQTGQCQQAHCPTTFGLLQRKHHCRSCGNIYCSTHSSNRLPLFTPTSAADKPVFSRVCDQCFYGLVGDSLSFL